MLPCFTCGHRDRSFRHQSDLIRCNAMFNQSTLVNPKIDLDCPIGKGVPEGKLQRRRK